MSLNEGQHCQGQHRRFEPRYTAFRQLEWTEAEDNAVRFLFPDYKAMEQVMRHRTYGALKNRAANIGIVPRKHVWTNAEVSRLRKMFPTAPHAELMEAFPGIALKNIKAKARHIGCTASPEG